MALSERDALLGPTRIEGVEYTQIKVEDVGTRVQVRDALHCKANHYIKESRPYFPRRKLTKYLEFPGMTPGAVVLWLCSFAGALALLGGHYTIVPVVSFIVGSLWVGILGQHETVSRRTLKLVLSQPVIRFQPSWNQFYRVTVSELKGVALENYQAGVGCVQVSEGIIQFQAFNPKAVKTMQAARRFSRVMLLLYIIAGAGNFYLIMAYTLGFT